MAIGKGNGRHWIRAAVKPQKSGLEALSAARLAQASQSISKKARVVQIMKKYSTEDRPERKARFQEYLKVRKEPKDR